MWSNAALLAGPYGPLRAVNADGLIALFPSVLVLPGLLGGGFTNLAVSLRPKEGESGRVGGFLEGVRDCEVFEGSFV